MVQVSPHLEKHLCQIAISKNKLGDFGSSADKIYLLKNLFNAFREFLIRLHIYIVTTFKGAKRIDT
ncbi:hypothetical protein AKA01nite_06110 [Alkalibacterium kapii]|uniref:Uncharacterized protein n=1 Tax=Alkalibacterium kapii TaxID=426704 RepID=A0A511AS06_9LACT|nr:hypothetical protein AKA01nite_06110 [Alkalibacterium kapii]